jgi:glycosyltransferase involved in cell wall biosynthesis
MRCWRTTECQFSTIHGLSQLTNRAYWFLANSKFDMSTHPQLTVVLPAHNAEATIAASIQSVLCQSYADFELWVLESRSSDRTAEVARSFTDSRVKVFELGSLSFQETLEFALENAQTEWLARMDADDLSFPERFSEQMKVFEQRPDLVLVGTQRVYLTPFGHIFEPTEKVVSKEIDRMSLRSLDNDRKFFVDASVIFNRDIALEVGGYDPEFQMGDVPLWFRMLGQGKGWEIAKPLYLYRLHPGSLLQNEIQPTDHAYRVIAKYVPELLHLYFPTGTFQAKPISWHRQYYWLRVAMYEALTGDQQAILHAVNFLDKDGPFKDEAKLIRWFTYFGSFGTTCYRWYRRNKYRHRPDLEKLFTDLVGPLWLDQLIRQEL